MQDSFGNMFENILNEEFHRLEKDYDGLQLVLDGIHYNCICDCTKNYGKTCKYPDKYRDGGCK